MRGKYSIAAGIVAAAGILIIALLLPTAANALGDNQIVAGAKRIGHVSAGSLESACGKSGGTYVETPDDYLCSTDSSWVYCEKKTGDCVGETDNKKGQKTNAGIANGQKLRTKVSGEKSRRRGRRNYPMGTTPIKR